MDGTVVLLLGAYGALPATLATSAEMVWPATLNAK
jgi:hypothetical protein